MFKQIILGNSTKQLLTYSGSSNSCLYNRSISLTTCYNRGISFYSTGGSGGKRKQSSYTSSKPQQQVKYTDKELKEAKEIQEFMKQQSNPVDLKTPPPKVSEPKPMNRKERRSMQMKLNRNHNLLVEAGVVSPRLPVPDHIVPPPYVKGEPVIDYQMDDEIPIQSKKDIEGMRKSCKLAAHILRFAGALVKPGITTDEIDRLVHEEMIKNNAYPSTLGYRGFPKSVCTSINEIICHGIPDSRPLVEGDIINIDITVYLEGYHGDTSATFKVGEVDSAASKLIEVTKQALEEGIKVCKPGAYFSSIGKSIQAYVHKHSFGLPIELTGHGIGKEFHTPPFIFHVTNDLDIPMEPGMIFTIEPIVAESTTPYVDWKLWDDKWTMSTKEGGWSAQFEHTILITETGVEILTL